MSFDKDWDSYAVKIDERRYSQEWQVLLKARESHWNEFFDVKIGDKILDAGCGHGDYSVYALKSGAKVWAFDYADEMVKCTEERISKSGLCAERIHKDSVSSINYSDAMFDTVFCLAVLDHLPANDRIKALKELTRVLKPGGSLYIDVPNRFAYHWRFAFGIMRLLKMYPPGKIHFFTPREIKRNISSCGLVFIKSLGMTICPPLSGIYTTDIRRITIFPQSLIDLLDRLYLKLEINLRRISFLKPLCWHYFLKATKPTDQHI